MAGKLNPLEVARQITPGKYPDGDGLYLVVAGPTSRNWSYRYWIGGKERWHGLGSLLDVSLKEARIKRDTARQQVRAGVDIVQAKRSAREEGKAAEAATAAPTFKKCAERYIEEHRAEAKPSSPAAPPEHPAPDVRCSDDRPHRAGQMIFRFSGFPARSSNTMP
jgi:hypothetical protein